MAGYYRLSAYYLAKTFSEIPLFLVIPTLFFTIVYWMAGINGQFIVYLQMLGMVLMTSIAAHVSRNVSNTKCRYVIVGTITLM